MEGEENDLTPFWQQSSDSRRRRLRRSSSLFLNSGAFLIVLIVTALAFIFIIIPPILSFTSQIFRPQLVKKSWDSLNLVLVLFAIVCGFLSRNNGESSSSYEDRTVTNSSSSSSIQAQRSNPSTPHQWYEYLDQTDSSNRLKSSSSHPDLRQESSWLVNRDERWRFYDDTHLTNYHPLGSDQLHHRRRPWQEPEKEEADRNLETKNIDVDTIQVRTDENSHVPEPPAPAPAPVTKRKAKRSYQAIGEKEEPETKDFSEVKKVISHPPPPPPSRPPPSPPPRPSPPEYQESEPNSGKSDKKRSTATKDFLTSLRRKKKKQRQKSKESFEFDSIVDSIDQSHPPPPPPLSSSYPHTSPPPPPPPPPPPSVFQNLFSSKKGKTRKPNSEPAPPPVATSTVRVSKSKALSKPNPVTEKPPLPIKTSNFYNAITAGSESPPMPMPAPPPPPPFKIQDWKFARHGDFLRIKSRESSRSGTPDLDGGDDSPSEGMSPVALEGGESPSSSSPAPAMFCSSPDVDTKADNFIARFRAGLRLEKENSIRERDRGKSRFGPQAGLGREQSKD